MQVRDYGRRHRPVAGLQQPQQVVVVVVEEEEPTSAYAEAVESDEAVAAARAAEEVEVEHADVLALPVVPEPGANHGCDTKCALLAWPSAEYRDHRPTWTEQAHPPSRQQKRPATAIVSRLSSRAGTLLASPAWLHSLASRQAAAPLTRSSHCPSPPSSPPLRNPPSPRP